MSDGYNISQDKKAFLIEKMRELAFEMLLAAQNLDTSLFDRNTKTGFHDIPVSAAHLALGLYYGQSNAPGLSTEHYILAYESAPKDVCLRVIDCVLEQNVQRDSRWGKSRGNMGVARQG